MTSDRRTKSIKLLLSNRTDVTREMIGGFLYASNEFSEDVVEMACSRLFRNKTGHDARYNFQPPELAQECQEVVKANEVAEYMKARGVPKISQEPHFSAEHRERMKMRCKALQLYMNTRASQAKGFREEFETMGTKEERDAAIKFFQNQAENGRT